MSFDKRNTNCKLVFYNNCKHQYCCYISNCSFNSRSFTRAAAYLSVTYTSSQCKLTDNHESKFSLFCPTSAFSFMSNPDRSCSLLNILWNFVEGKEKRIYIHLKICTRAAWLGSMNRCSLGPNIWGWPAAIAPHILVTHLSRLYRLLCPNRAMGPCFPVAKQRDWVVRTFTWLTLS